MSHTELGVEPLLEVRLERRDGHPSASGFVETISGEAAAEDAGEAVMIV